MSDVEEGRANRPGAAAAAPPRPPAPLPHGHTPPNPSLLFQRREQGIAIKTPAHAASSFKSTMSLVSTSLTASSLMKGSFVRQGAANNASTQQEGSVARGGGATFRMSGENVE